MGKVAEWWGGKGGRFLVLFKIGGLRMSSKFHLFVYDVNQGNERERLAKDFITWCRDEKTLLVSSASC